MSVSTNAFISDNHVSEMNSIGIKNIKRISTCLHSGMEYEKRISNIIKNLKYNDTRIHVGETAGARNDCIDIPIQIGNIKSGIEAKNLGAFEGGSKKLYPTQCGMRIQEECIHKNIIGSRVLYDGAILPWNDGKKTAEDWTAVEHIFKPDIYIDAPCESIAEYYERKGANYIQVEGYGLYHTGNDIFSLGVPKFECDVKLRIRSTKHIKNGIPTDITAGLQFNRKTLKKSTYCLESALPPAFTPAAEAE